MSSVMTPVNVCFAGAADSAETTRSLTIRCFIVSTIVKRGRRVTPPSRARLFLFSRCHEVGGRRTRVHDPHAPPPAVLRQSECLHRRARHGDGHVRAGMLL